MKMAKIGGFVNVEDLPQRPQTVMTVLQGISRNRASPPLELEMQSIGSFVAIHGDGRGGFAATPLLPQTNGDTVETGFEEVGGGYLEGCDGYYVINPRLGAEPIRFTDFRMSIARIEDRVNVDGSQRRFYVVTLFEENGETVRIDVPEDEWGDLGPTIDLKHPGCQIFHDVVPQAGVKFRRLAGLILKRTSPEVRTVQSFWGWGKREENGTRTFFHGGREDCISSKKLFPKMEEETTRRQLLRGAWDIMSVGPHIATFPTVVYSLSAYLDAPFTDAGLPLNFSAMAIGDSGSLKSAFVKVICAPCVFPVDKRLHNIRGTEAAMNKLHEDTYDDTLLIDDFNLEGTPKEVQKKMKLLRAVIRDFSDKSAREKFGNNGNVVKYAIRGGCVITGETRMTGQLRSGELRYLRVPFPCPLDGDKLSPFQANPRLFGFFASEFIRHVESHFASIVRMVASRIPMMRHQTAVKALRLVGVYVFLALAAEVIGGFLLENEVLSRGEVDSWIREAQGIFLALVQEQESGANQREPFIRYIEEVWDLIGTGKLRVAASLDDYVKSIERYSGYVDGSLLMLKKDEVFSLVMASFSSRSEYLLLTTDDVSRLLKEHGFSKCDGKSCLKKASSKIPGRPRMLALIKEKCEKKVEENSNG